MEEHHEDGNYAVRRFKCRYGLICNKINCRYQHPNEEKRNRSDNEECRYGDKCTGWNCYGCIKSKEKVDECSSKNEWNRRGYAGI